MKIREEILELQNEKYREFNIKLCPDTKLKMLGIKVPQIRELAKNILKIYTIEEALEEIQEEYFEEVLLKGLVIGNAKGTFKNKKKYIEEFIPLIDSWAISDTFVPSIKPKKEELEEVLEFILPYLKSKKEFEVRVGVIFLLDYFITDEYVDKVIELLDRIKHEGYYVKMAVAWTLAEIGIKYYEKLTKYITGKNNLDKFTHNKAIQKMRESRRIKDEQKEYLKSLKK